MTVKISREKETTKTRFLPVCSERKEKEGTSPFVLWAEGGGATQGRINATRNVLLLLLPGLLHPPSLFFPRCSQKRGGWGQITQDLLWPLIPPFICAWSGGVTRAKYRDHQKKKEIPGSGRQGPLANYLQLPALLHISTNPEGGGARCHHRLLLLHPHQVN